MVMSSPNRDAQSLTWYQMVSQKNRWGHFLYITIE